MNTLFEIDHGYLVRLAAHWLRVEKNCHVVVTELRFSAACEIPDAIGFHYAGNSTLVECKSSRRDFQRDARKGCIHFRMGRMRYYLVPQGLVAPDEVPAPWGLLYATEGRVRLIKRAAPGWEHGETDDHRRASQRREIELLLAALRRPWHRGVFIRSVPEPPGQ